MGAFRITRERFILIFTRGTLTTRRSWIGAAILAGAGCGRFRSDDRQFIGTIPFEDEGRAPLDKVIGDELDGRLYTNLSSVDSAGMVTPTERFYIRTRASHLLSTGKPWSIQAGGRTIAMRDLSAQAQSQGVHLMECAGNMRAVSFGMISVAQWEGVPLAPLLDLAGFDRHTRILVSGFDQYSAAPVTPSIAGASWIFSRGEIEQAGAFLATSMNGQPLTPDHGAPVRLVLPGWYGCACIKWVNEIMPVEEDAPATSQMREYAARTQQHGMPERASDYQPATIDPVGMPIRVEKWLTGGRIQYNVVGIVWGGTPPNEQLLIRYGPDEPYVPVSQASSAHGSWGLWRQNWRPTRPGIYRIRLRLADASIRTRRLDEGFYVRRVRIEEV